tara:strand:+ start:817 stop:1041 length:225 start_codon:yes stop_codon:yes gene_type:complete
MNYDNWKLASPPENDMVSYCCGSEFEELEIMGEIVYKCHKCKDLFDEPEEDYEFLSRQHEAYLEDRMDEDRLGL